MKKKKHQNTSFKVICVGELHGFKHKRAYMFFFSQKIPQILGHVDIFILGYDKIQYFMSISPSDPFQFSCFVAKFINFSSTISYKKY